jgi:hypothetical protein
MEEKILVVGMLAILTLTITALLLLELPRTANRWDEIACTNNPPRTYTRQSKACEIRNEEEKDDETGETVSPNPPVAGGNMP